MYTRIQENDIVRFHRMHPNPRTPGNPKPGPVVGVFDWGLARSEVRNPEVHLLRGVALYPIITRTMKCPTRRSRTTKPPPYSPSKPHHFADSARVVIIEVPTMETGPNLEVTPTVSASPGVSPDPCLTPFRVVKSPRVLACILCQQRKVKCDRKFPCANCIKSRIQCVPATPNRRQPRRSEQELSDRLRKYEELLHQNNIPFERLSGELAHDDFPFDAGSGNSVHEEHSQTTNRTWVTMTASDENTSHDAAEYVSSRRYRQFTNFDRSVWHSMIQGVSRV